MRFPAGRWRGLAARALDLLYPTRCLVCDRDFAAADSPLLCPPCADAFPRIVAPMCARCAQPFGPHALAPAECSNCRERALAFEWAAAYGRYEGRLRDAIHRLKFFGMDLLARPLGERLAEAARTRAGGTVAWDLVVPVPPSELRRFPRPRNPAELVAIDAARCLGVRFDSRVLRKKTSTQPQSALDRRGRLENLIGCMEVLAPERVSGKVILIVDDILTTGATGSEAARALRAAGARTCHLATIAR